MQSWWRCRDKEAEILIPKVDENFQNIATDHCETLPFVRVAPLKQFLGSLTDCRQYLTVWLRIRVRMWQT